MLNLGLIGFGRFGQFAAPHLRARLHVFVWDIRDLRRKAASQGVTWGTLEEAASCQIVVLAVPATEIPAVLTRIAPMLRPGALLMDVASVKTLPVQWMLEETRPEVEVIGTHPLFGPDSAKTGIEGMTIALCPARTTRAESAVEFLSSMGLRVAVTTPEEHDRQMAQVQAVTHFMARALDRAGLRDHALKTPSYERLLAVVKTLVKDSPDMFHSLETLNPWAAEERTRLLDALHAIDKQLLEE